LAPEYCLMGNASTILLAIGTAEESERQLRRLYERQEKTGTRTQMEVFWLLRIADERT